MLLNIQTSESQRLFPLAWQVLLLHRKLHVYIELKSAVPPGEQALQARRGLKLTSVCLHVSGFR